MGTSFRAYSQTALGYALFKQDTHDGYPENVLEFLMQVDMSGEGTLSWASVLKQSAYADYLYVVDHITRQVRVYSGMFSALKTGLPVHCVTLTFAEAIGTDAATLYDDRCDDAHLHS